MARDHTDTVCSPCRRTLIERAARRESSIAHDRSGIKAAFDSSGVYGVAGHLDCSPEEAFDVVVSARLISSMPERRRAVLRRLVGMRDSSHVAVADALDISRWTVASYRHQLGIDRAPEKSGGRGRRTAVDERNSIEFADLLDTIEPADNAPVVAPEATIADLVMFPVTPKADEHIAAAVAPIDEQPAEEPAEAPIPPIEEPDPPTPVPTVSRFADTGIDDDLLPLPAAPHRRFRR